ncbi:MAG TPA: potassium channel family protein [Actinomycetes bacterium]|jgi:voltage-gated potassium channel Kch|nr:potassium channel family protein [Actinomycetes bacterium]
MAAVLIAAGSCLLLLGLWDTALTVLHPARRGPLSHAINRGTWLLVRTLSRRPGSSRLLSFAGPAAMAGGFFGWVGGLWVGFALIYLPFIDRFSYSETVPFGAKGLAEALYVSGVSLSTVGFGDVVASSDTLRLVTVAESASGLAAITAAITYLLSVYPLVTRQRSAALHASDLGLTEPAQVVRVAMQGGSSVLVDLQHALIEAHQHVTRFPVLYYFHPDQPEESMNRLLRAGIMVCLVLRWGVRQDEPDLPVVFGPALEATVRRVVNDYDANYVGGRAGGGGQPAPLDPAEAAARLDRLRTQVEAAVPGLGATDREVPKEFAAFLGWADARLARLAREHGFEGETLAGA